MMKSIGIYIHLPFCQQKCYYCDYLSYANCKEAEVEAYLWALVREIKLYRQLLGRIKAKSVYLGGGTPTYLTIEQLTKLFNSLEENFDLPKGIEITVEVNPGFINKEKVSFLFAQGCNRLSIGGQSFRARDLKILGRLHSPKDIEQTFELARWAGFTNLSLDLMYGLPGQSLAQWSENLRLALKLKPEHLAVYQLKIEPDTPFGRLWARGLWEACTDELAVLMYEKAKHFLVEHGYRHYEISSYALLGKAAKHNSLYWLNEPYLGLGAGAAGFLKQRRYLNQAKLKDYYAFLEKGKLPLAEWEEINEELARAETMFLGLRLLKGIAKDTFIKKHHVRLEDHYAVEISKLKKQGLLKETATHLALTEKGIRLANLVWLEFL